MCQIPSDKMNPVIMLDLPKKIGYKFQHDIISNNVSISRNKT